MFEDREFLCLLDDKTVLRGVDCARLIIDYFLTIKTFRGTLRKIIEVFGGCVGFRTAQGLSSWLSNPALRGYLVYKRSKQNRYSDRSKWEFRGKFFDELITDHEWIEIEGIFQNITYNRTFYRSSGNYTLPFGGLMKCQNCFSSAMAIGSLKTSAGYQCIKYREVLS